MTTLSKNKSNQFRYVYSNGFGIQSTGSEIVLVFGFKENPQDKDGEALNEVGVIVTPITMKMLAVSLQKLTEFLERSAGAPIPIEAEKLANIDKQFSESTTAPTSSPPPS